MIAKKGFSVSHSLIYFSLAAGLINLTSCSFREEKNTSTFVENPAYAFSPAVEAIIANHTCLDCHAGSGQANLTGTILNSPTRLVTNSASSGIRFIVPGDPENSALYQKVKGTASWGSQMPANAPSDNTYLDAAELADLADWITNLPQ